MTYSFTQEITPRELTITLDTTKVYDGLQFVSTLTAATNGQSNGYTIAGLQNGATISGVVTSRAKNVDTYEYTGTTAPTSGDEMTITTEFTTSDDITNYSVSYDFTQVITPRELTITLDTMKVYDGLQFVSTITAATNGQSNGYVVSGLQNGATISGVVTSSAKDVDTYDYTGTTAPTSSDEMTITTAFTTSDDISNYSVSYDFTQVITLRELTITINDTKVYDGTPLVTNYNGTAVSTTGLQNGATLTAGVVTTPNSVVDIYTDNMGANITTAFATSDDISNYSVTYDFTQEITPAAITIAADNKTKVYDNNPSTDPALTATVTGVPAGGVAPVYSLSRAAGQNMGNYTITVTVDPASNPNYTVTTQTGVFSITPRPNVVVTIQEHGAEVEYDGTVQTVTGYSVSINDPLYSESDITFTGNDVVSDMGSENVLTIINMNLHSTDFSNHNPNFTGVSFIILDSALYIYPKLKAEATTTLVFCHTGNNGTARIDVTGGKRHYGKYYFSFEGAPNEEYFTPHTYSNLTEGNYSVVVTDSLGYQVTVNFTISEIEELTASIVTPADLCPNQGTYPVSVVVNGGTPDYSYEWSGDAANVNANATTVAQNGVNDGQHTYNVAITVTDFNGCLAMASAAFTVKPSVEQTGSVTYTCSNDTSIMLRYGAVDTLVILHQPTWSSNIPDMPLTLVLEGATANNRYRIPEGLEDTTYIVRWHLVDTCGGDSLICTQRIVLTYPVCSPMVLNGYTYPSKRIGGNCWTRENLRLTQTRSTRAVSGIREYNDSDSLQAIYGNLYSWYTALGVAENDDAATPTYVDGHVQGACADGWAIPTDEDYIHMLEGAGGMPYVRSTNPNYWVSSLVGSEPASGFDARGGGMYSNATGYYESLMTMASFWSCSSVPGSSAMGSTLQCAVCDGEFIIRSKKDCHSIRCVKVR